VGWGGGGQASDILRARPRWFDADLCNIYYVFSGSNMPLYHIFIYFPINIFNIKSISVIFQNFWTDYQCASQGGGLQWIDGTLKALKKKIQTSQAKLTLQSNEAAAALRKAGLADKIKVRILLVSWPSFFVSWLGSEAILDSFPLIWLSSFSSAR